ncbi:MAG: hypothetical protein KC496_09750, partial [Anaerolineae bacterium]|nr:hypothetical protein [Anaerolineae bacterium]
QVEQLTHEIIHARTQAAAGGVSSQASLPVRLYQAILPLSIRRRFRFRQRLVGLYQRIVPLSVRTRWYQARHNK